MGKFRVTVVKAYIFYRVMESHVPKLVYAGLTILLAEASAKAVVYTNYCSCDK